MKRAMYIKVGVSHKKRLFVRCHSEANEAAEKISASKDRSLQDPHSEGMTEVGIVGIACAFAIGTLCLAMGRKSAKATFAALPYPQSHECECNIVCQDMAGGF